MRKQSLRLVALLQLLPAVETTISSTELRKTACSSFSSTARTSLLDDLDRVLFWSSYEFNVDAATQNIGPLVDTLEESSPNSLVELCRLEESLKELQEKTPERLQVEQSPLHEMDNDTSVQISSPTAPQHEPLSATDEALLVPRGGGAKYSLFQKNDGSESDPDGIPTRFLRMHNGDRKAAKDSLEAALKWRRSNGIDTILSSPQPKYDLCKTVFPHYFLGRNPSGHIVFVQHPAQLNLQRARENELAQEDLLMHYVFVNEYLWQVLEKDEPLGTMLSIIDLHELPLGILRQMDVINFVKEFVSTMDSYYPQRAHKTLLVNAPKWFSTIYKLLSPLMRETTKEKISILNRGKAQDEALRQHLGKEVCRNLPDFFWSSWKPKKRSKKRKRRQAEEEGDNDDDGDKNDFALPDTKLEKQLRDFTLAGLKSSRAEMQAFV